MSKDIKKDKEDYLLYDQRLVEINLVDLILNDKRKDREILTGEESDYLTASVAETIY